jgi:hypothetical protein
MKISLHFSIFATFAEGEPCNPLLLKEFCDWLDFVGIGFSIYKRKNISKNYQIEQIQLFGPSWLDSTWCLQISEKIMELYSEPIERNEEKEQVIPAMPEEHQEITVLENREEVLQVAKQQNNVQTSLFSFDNERASSKIQSTSRKNGRNSEIKSKNPI